MKKILRVVLAGALGGILGFLLGLLGHWRASGEGFSDIPIFGQVAGPALVGFVAGGVLSLLGELKSRGLAGYCAAWVLAGATGAACLALLGWMIDGYLDATVGGLLIIMGAITGLALAATIKVVEVNVLGRRGGRSE